MNPLILTKIAKHTLIGSISAYISFSGKHSPNVRLFFIYVVAGVIATFILAMLWESRDYLTNQDATEDDISTVIGGLTNSRPETRKYMLPAKVRLEICIALVVVVVCALVGAI